MQYFEFRNYTYRMLYFIKYIYLEVTIVSASSYSNLYMESLIFASATCAWATFCIENDINNEYTLRFYITQLFVNISHSQIYDPLILG